MVVGAGFEPAKAVLADLQSAPFGQLGNPSTNANGTSEFYIIQNILSSLTWRLVLMLKNAMCLFRGKDFLTDSRITKVIWKSILFVEVY